MRRWFITVALFANALISGLVLLLLLNGGGWGGATKLSPTVAEIMVIVALVALVLDLLLIPVLGISFRAHARKLHRQEAALEAQRHQAPTDSGIP